MNKQIIMKLTIKTLSTSVLALVGVVNSPFSSHAYEMFFGEDLNMGGNGNPPLTSFPKASQAETDFLSNLSIIGTEDFESFSEGQIAPLNLTFPSVGTATLSRSGVINAHSSTHSMDGGYPISGDQNWFTIIEDGGFTIDFNQPIVGLGFYASDLETSQLVIQLSRINGTTETKVIPNTVFPLGEGSGSVFYSGLIAKKNSEIFTSVSFSFTNGNSVDGVGFDKITISSDVSPIVSTPEPTSWLSLLGFTLTTLGITSLKRRHKSSSNIIE